MTDVASTSRQHAYTGPALPQLPEPSYAERVRTLASLTSVATVSTMSRRHAGYPFGSLMPYALDSQGRPLFLISNMAMHTQNLKADARASLFITQATVEDDPLGAARATLVGEAEAVPLEEIAAVREQYLARHAGSRYWVDFTDFSFFRLEPKEVYYVGGFGVMGWVSADEYKAASPDPLSSSAAGILTHMNTDHVESMLLLARAHAQIEATEAAMTSVDRLGFHLRLKSGAGVQGLRLNYPHEARSALEVRTELVQMVREAQRPQN